MVVAIPPRQREQEHLPKLPKNLARKEARSSTMAMAQL
jgi:hypothetical protein